MSAYSAITGGVLSFLSQVDFTQETVWVVYFLIWITIVGLLLTVRWSQAFEEHRGRTNQIIKQMDLDSVIRSFNMDIPPRGVFRILKTRHWFYFFYCGMLGGLLVLAYSRRLIPDCPF